jgi:hypothetical protein
MQMMLDEFTKYGNLLSACPMVPGSYYMKDYTMDETVSAITRMMQENLKFMSIFTLTDENSRKPAQIFTFQIWFWSNHSNWQQ